MNPASRRVQRIYLILLFICAFYALQPYPHGPYPLEPYGDPAAYSIAGLAAAILSLAQITGGVLAPRIRDTKVVRAGTGAPDAP